MIIDSRAMMMMMMMKQCRAIYIYCTLHHSTYTVLFIIPLVHAPFRLISGIMQFWISTCDIQWDGSVNFNNTGSKNVVSRKASLYIVVCVLGVVVCSNGQQLHKNPAEFSGLCLITPKYKRKCLSLCTLSSHNSPCR